MALMDKMKSCAYTISDPTKHIAGFTLFTLLDGIISGVGSSQGADSPGLNIFITSNYGIEGLTTIRMPIVAGSAYIGAYIANDIEPYSKDSMKRGLERISAASAFTVMSAMALGGIYYGGYVVGYSIDKLLN